MYPFRQASVLYVEMYPGLGAPDLAHALNFVGGSSTTGYYFFYSIFCSLLHQVSVKLTTTTVATIPKNPKYSTLQ